MTMNDQDLAQPSSYLFTVRVWIEAGSKEQSKLRVQVKHVLSGEMSYFREWSSAIAFILAKLQESEAG